MANIRKPEHKKLARKVQIHLTESEYDLIRQQVDEEESLSACARRILLHAVMAAANGYQYVGIDPDMRTQLERIAHTMSYTGPNVIAQLLGNLALAATEWPVEDVERFLFGQSDAAMAEQVNTRIAREDAAKARAVTTKPAHKITAKLPQAGEQAA